MKKRMYYLDLLRILAAIGVVMIHTSMMYINKVHVRSDNYMFFNIYSSISRFAVPIFVMISGIYFLNPKNEIAIKKIYNKYILRLSIIFVVWSVFYAYVTKGLNLTSLIKGNYHLWCLSMIIGLYIITPLLRQITQSKHLMRYFLIIGFIFTFFIPNVFSVMKLFKGITRIERLLYLEYSYMNFHFTLGYIYYYVLGYYLTTIKISKIKEYLIYFFGILGVLTTIFLSRFASIRSLIEIETFYENFTINVLLETLAIFVLFKNHFSHIQLPQRWQKFIIYMSRCTLGIYVIHPLILKVLDDRFHLNTLSFNGLISVPVITCIAFLTSLIFTIILRKIPLVKKTL